jgi:acyl-CoA thioester hydrolase
MKTHESVIRVRYCETDQMGVAHHSHFLNWFEVGRTDYLATLGVRYKDLEARGNCLMVVGIGCNYVSPARYEEEIVICSRISELARFKIRFEYELKQKTTQKSVANGFSVLVSVGKDGKICSLGQDILDLLKTSQ